MSKFPEFLGWCVIVAGTGLGVGAIMAALYAVMVAFFSTYAKKVHNAAVNWQAVHQWVQNGRPQWVLGKDKIYRMVPSAGAYEEKE